MGGKQRVLTRCKGLKPLFSYMSQHKAWRILMKAIVYTEFGPPDVLQLKEVEKPTPKEDEVLVNVHAASVNFGDVSFASGKPFLVRLIGAGLFKPKNAILGSDIAGRIEAVGKSVKPVHNIPGIDIPGQFNLNFRFLGGIIGNGPYLNFISPGGRFNGSDQGFGGRPEGDLPDNNPLFIAGVHQCAGKNFTIALFILRNINQSSRGEIGIQSERFAVQTGPFRLQNLYKIMWEDFRRHTDGDPLRADNQGQRDLAGKNNRLFFPAVVGIGKFGNFRIIKNIPGQGEKTAFDITGR